MRYLAWVLWGAAAIWALGSAHSIRTMVRTGKPPTRQTVNMVMLWLIGLLCIVALGLSPFHVFWWFPVAFIAGALSLAFPFSLLSIPGQLFGTLCLAGLNQMEVQRNAERQRQFEDLCQRNVEAGMSPEEAKKAAVAVFVDEARRSPAGR